MYPNTALQHNCSIFLYICFLEYGNFPNVFNSAGYLWRHLQKLFIVKKQLEPNVKWRDLQLKPTKCKFLEKIQFSKRCNFSVFENFCSNLSFPNINRAYFKTPKSPKFFWKIRVSLDLHRIFPWTPCVHSHNHFFLLSFQL